MTRKSLISILLVIACNQAFANKDEVVEIPSSPKKTNGCALLNTQKIGEAEVFGSVRDVQRTELRCILKLSPQGLRINNSMVYGNKITPADLVAVGVDVGVLYDHTCDSRGMISLYQVANYVMKFQRTCRRADGRTETSTYMALDR